MPAKVTRFEWHDEEFTEFAHSQQMLDPTVEAATEVAAAATGSQMLSKTPYTVQPNGPSVVIDGKARLSVLIEGNDPFHAIEEFGSGSENEGSSGKGGRAKQGGSSEARRTLIRSAHVIIPQLTKRPG